LLKHIFLIGYRGSGKSTVAKHLAARLGLGVIDTDDWVEQFAGKTIKEIFAFQGERKFREHETTAIVRLVNKPDALVVSLGGGAVLSKRNRDVIKQGFTIWLQADPETLFERVAHDPATRDRRPRLTDGDELFEEICTVLKERTPLYEECAGCSVNTEEKTVQEICDEIFLWLNEAVQERQRDA
jgi:shikimate kinase